MDIFFQDSRATKIWGPTASTTVEVEALNDVVNDKWVLAGMTMGAKEIVDVRQCFNDTSFIYAFGNDQSSCQMSLLFMIYIGKCKKEDMSQMENVVKGYEQYKKTRISENPIATEITIGNFSRYGWLTGLNIGQVDPMRGTCRGTASFLVEL